MNLQVAENLQPRSPPIATLSDGQALAKPQRCNKNIWVALQLGAPLRSPKQYACNKSTIRTPIALAIKVTMTLSMRTAHPNSP